MFTASSAQLSRNTRWLHPDLSDKCGSRSSEWMPVWSFSSNLSLSCSYASDLFQCFATPFGTNCRRTGRIDEWWACESQRRFTRPQFPNCGLSCDCMFVYLIQMLFIYILWLYFSNCRTAIGCLRTDASQDRKWSTHVQIARRLCRCQRWWTMEVARRQMDEQLIDCKINNDNVIVGYEIE